jgi:hypothetical protein
MFAADLSREISVVNSSKTFRDKWIDCGLDVEGRIILKHTLKKYNMRVNIQMAQDMVNFVYTVTKFRVPFHARPILS